MRSLIWLDQGSRTWRSLGRPRVMLAITAPALLLSLLVVPRPVAPRDVPLPRIDWQVWERQQQALNGLVTEARRAGLSYEVRVVGELVRRWGRAEFAGDERQLRQLRQRLEAAVQRALLGGDGPLLALRAVQCDAFVRVAGRRSTASAWRELGGRLAQRASEQAWLQKATVPELWAACLVRWTSLTGIQERARFAPSPELMKLLFHVRYRAAAEQPLAQRAARWLKMIDSLQAYDSTYPAAYARGIGFYLVNDYAAAFAEFRRYLAQHPDGPWTLRARNYAQAAALGSGVGE